MSTRVSLVLTPLLVAASASGLNAQYRRQPADTLRYREVTRTTITLETPQGTFRVSSLHDATIALTFGTADTAIAWYEALTLALHGPTGELRPETGPALKRPFLLSFDARGRITTLRAPQFPSSFDNVSDLSKQFADYFLRLPSDFDLSAGRAWTDTVVQMDTARGGGRTEFRRVIEYRVVGDTSLAAQSGRVIEIRQQVRLTSVAPVAGQPLTAHNELSGVDSGVFVFSPTRGRMLARDRSAVLVGAITYVGGAQPVVVRERFAYTNTVDAVR